VLVGPAGGPEEGEKHNQQSEQTHERSKPSQRNLLSR
jgi:hypothetical protein